MNPIQMAQQIKAVLETVVWPGGAGEVVFGADGVYVFAGLPTEDQIPPGFPWVLVGIDGGQADEDHPELLTQQFTILSAADVAGDPLGEQGIIGGSVDDLGKSAGRGVGELAERVRVAVGNLLGDDGANIKISTNSTGRPTPIGGGRHLVLDELTLTAICTSELAYAAPQKLNHDGSDWTWSGAHCSSRFDFLQYRLVRLSGTTPSANPSDGTVVATQTGTTFTGVATSGNTYTVFADYNGRGGATVEGSSPPDVGAYKVVV